MQDSFYFASKLKFYVSGTRSFGERRNDWRLGGLFLVEAVLPSQPISERIAVDTAAGSHPLLHHDPPFCCGSLCEKEFRIADLKHFNTFRATRVEVYSEGVSNFLKCVVVVLLFLSFFFSLFFFW